MTMTRSSTRPGARLAVLAAALAGLAACAVVNPTPPQLYTLTPATRFEEGLPRANWQLLIELPAAPAGLDTPRIAVLRGRTEQDYVADVSWTDRAPALVQSLLVESFEESGRIVSVGRDNAGLRSDVVLKTELRDFQAEYADNGRGLPDQVRVRIAAKLVSVPRRTIETSETFTAVAPIREGSGAAPIVTAFDQALGEVMTRVVEWTLRNGGRVVAIGRPESPPPPRTAPGS